VILKIDIVGEIGLKDLTAEKIQNSLLDSREGMLSGNRVKAILLNINTPGGAADDSDSIYRALMAYKQKYQVPIYAYVDGLCASGGMYIASAAEKVYASPSSVIGSIGVLMGPTFNVSGLMDMYGVKSLTLTEGKDKDMLNPFRPWVPGEDNCLRTINADLYMRFVNIVTTARPKLDKHKLIAEYGAQVYSCETAMQLGYIDVANSNYDAALIDLAKAANLPDPQYYQVFTIEPEHTFLSDLTTAQSPLLTGKITHHFQFQPGFNSEFSGRFLYLYQPN
jgi:signal peptide peptidase SppA